MSRDLPGQMGGTSSPGRPGRHVDPRRSSRGAAGVAERECGVARQPAPFGAFNGRAAERLAEAFVVHLDQRLEVETRAGAGLELLPAARAVAPGRVIRTHLLANIAAEYPLADARPEVVGDGATVLDGEVRNTALGGQVVGRVERVGGTRVDAQTTRAAVLLD